MKSLIFGGVVAVIWVPAQAASPIAEVICEASKTMHHRLTSRLGSTRQALGLQGPEQVMELWTNPSGDWTMVVTYAAGTSCIVAMGEDWQVSIAGAVTDGVTAKNPS